LIAERLIAVSLFTNPWIGVCSFEKMAASGSTLVPKVLDVRHPTRPEEIAVLREALEVLGLSKLWSIPWDICSASYLEDFGGEPAD